MKFYKMNAENAKRVTQYNSNFLMNSFMHLNCELRISVMTLKEMVKLGFIKQQHLNYSIYLKAKASFAMKIKNIIPSKKV
ncbi:hypothetical protein CW357_09865 [Rummeliibacillus sp. TYF005]|nr:hypothetical protein D1606_03055 [Rummeliibacillus sp. POC4]RPJ95508.1 hypothetical protein CW357_09865 [Rummeliibacillus sp. TYF005]